LNKQGNLNEFFDITAGSGTYAPTKRQAYASKRLQHVVSEFRSAQAKHRDRGMSPGSAADPQGEEGVDNAPVKKRAKTAIRKSRAGKSSKESRSKAQTSPHSESDSEGDMYQGERGKSPPPLRVELRPRRKAANAVTKSGTPQ
jgi:DNA excision repair protein ERCC-5